ncbi:helix-turn-helix domain-containing protein [Pedobacter sp. NJ-S-72]
MKNLKLRQQKVRKLLLIFRDLANIAGIAKENVIRLLKELKSEDIIETEGRKIWVKNIAKLVARSNYK